MLDAVFDLKSGVWRSITTVDGTAFVLKKQYQYFDATQQLDWSLPFKSSPTHMIANVIASCWVNSC